MTTAKVISSKYKGIFPKDYHQILQLKGVGEYTAAAVASFSFNQPYPVIDGNVYRVLSRIFGLKVAIDSSEGKKAFNKLANELIDKKAPADYNQAIMEFGALQCKPKNPNCDNCPFLGSCYAQSNAVIDQLPFKSKKIKTRNRYFNYFVIHKGDNTYLEKRKENDIWKGLYHFPLVETEGQIEDFSALMKLSPNYFSSSIKN